MSLYCKYPDNCCHICTVMQEVNTYYHLCTTQVKNILSFKGNYIKVYWEYTFVYFENTSVSSQYNFVYYQYTFMYSNTFVCWAWSSDIGEKLSQRLDM
jgi:hypothetical protein